MDTDRLQSLLIDYKRSQKGGHGLQSLLIEQKKTTKVGIRLQSLLIYYKRLQKSELDYKVK